MSAIPPWGGPAPYLSVPEHGDDPRVALADAAERLGDRLYAVARRAGEMTRHEATWCGAGPLMERIEALLTELEDETGVGP